MSAGDLARFGHVHKCVHIHLCVNAQVLQVRLGDHLADRIGHSADSQLQAGAVGDSFDHKLRDSLVNIRSGLCRRHRVDRCVVTLYDHIDITDVNISGPVAQADRHTLIDFHNDFLSHLNNRVCMAGAGTKVKVSVSVHRSDLHDRHIQGILSVEIVARKLRVLERPVEAESCGSGFSLHAVHMPAVPGEVVLGILDLEDLRRVHQNSAVDLHVVHLGHSLREFSVDSHVRGRAPSVINPVAVLNDRCRLLRSNQFLFIFFCVTHFSLHPSIILIDHFAGADSALLLRQNIV